MAGGQGDDEGAAFTRRAARAPEQRDEAAREDFAAPGTIEDAIHDTNAAVGHVLETWGRTIEFSYLTRTGTDEAAQRGPAATDR